MRDWQGSARSSGESNDFPVVVANRRLPIINSGRRIGSIATQSMASIASRRTALCSSVELAPATNFPHVQQLIVQVLDDQFSDVRAMLQLPRPDIGITPACNFAIVSSLCNLISGISTTIYKPLGLLHELRSPQGKSGPAFKDMVRDFFPYSPTGATDFPKELYDLCRNPMAHSVGLMDPASPIVEFTRIFDPSHYGVGWSDQQLEDLERPDRPYSFPYSGIVIDSQRWTLHCDAFYLDVIEMLRRLNADSVQMTAAENRFSHAVFNWRR